MEEKKTYEDVIGVYGIVLAGVPLCTYCTAWDNKLAEAIFP